MLEEFSRLSDKKARPAVDRCELFLDITNRCIKRVPKRRPQMSEVGGENQLVTAEFPLYLLLYVSIGLGAVGECSSEVELSHLSVLT